MRGSAATTWGPDPCTRTGNLGADSRSRPKQTITTITDRVMEGMAEWQSRILDPVYAVIFIDAINVKIREGQVANRPVYLALGVTVDGERDGPVGRGARRRGRRQVLAAGLVGDQEPGR